MSTLGHYILTLCSHTRATNHLILSLANATDIAWRLGVSVKDVERWATKLEVWVIG